MSYCYLMCYNVYMKGKTAILILTLVLLLSLSSCSQHVHEWTLGTIIREATCTETGLAMQVCAVCGEMHEIETEKRPHVEGQTTTISPTCTEPGAVNVTCLICWQVISSTTLPALGHDWWPVEGSYEPTCEHEGHDCYSCSRCNEIRIDFLPALGHDFSGPVERIDPTETENGMEFPRCTRCSLAQCVILPKTAIAE